MTKSKLREIIREEIQKLNEGTSYLELSDGNTTVSLYKDGSNWYEDEVIDGKTPKGWGSQTYMSYLKGKDIASWLSRDYGGRWKVIDES